MLKFLYNECCHRGEYLFGRLSFLLWKDNLIVQYVQGMPKLGNAPYQFEIRYCRHNSWIIILWANRFCNLRPLILLLEWTSIEWTSKFYVGIRSSFNDCALRPQYSSSQASKMDILDLSTSAHSKIMRETRKISRTMIFYQNCYFRDACRERNINHDKLCIMGIPRAYQSVTKIGSLLSLNKKNKKILKNIRRRAHVLVFF